MQTRNPRLRMYIRLDALGQAIPNSAVLRFHKPKTGNWRDITSAVGDCCNKPAFVTLTNTNTSSQIITSIKTDRGFSFTGSAGIGKLVAIPVPVGTTTITVTVNAAADVDRAITSVTNFATGTITACTMPTAHVYTIVVDANGGDQFIVTLGNASTC